MAKNIIMTAGENDPNCNFGAPCLTQMITMTVTDRGDNNCYHNTLFH